MPARSAATWASTSPATRPSCRRTCPGAGGNKAAGYVYSVAPKDGTAIGALFPGGILAPLLADTPIQHDPAKFIFVGSANSDVYTCVVPTSTRRSSRFKDVLAQEMIVGASNEGGTTRDLPAMSNNVLGAKFRIVTGYSGTREIALAVERKEIHGLCGYGYTSLLSRDATMGGQQHRAHPGAGERQGRCRC